MINLFLFSVAVVGGALNAVAGGGSFLTLPALIYAGVAPVAANATSTFALWPGSVSSAFAYRREISGAHRWLLWLGAVSLVGGLLGALLLVRTSDSSFMRLLPWLMLLAAVMFTFGAQITTRLRRLRPVPAVSRPQPARAAAEHGAGAATQHLGLEARQHLAGEAVEHPAGEAAEHSAGEAAEYLAGEAVDRGAGEAAVPVWALALQLAIAIYGGYFGGGMGIMMLASLAVGGMTNIHEMNGVKTVLAVAINGVAMAEFVWNGAIEWLPGFVMMAGGITGGYVGASLARRIPGRFVRAFVIVIAWTMTMYFFAR